MRRLWQRVVCWRRGHKLFGTFTPGPGVKVTSRATCLRCGRMVDTTPS